MRRKLDLQELVVGNGCVERAGNVLRLYKGMTLKSAYSNAQVDDYGIRPRTQFDWYAPLQLRVSARFSAGVDALHGTAGFGFWNDPFVFGRGRWPALPRAIWFFFASRHSNMALALDVPGHGWKAATIDASTWACRLLLPLAPLVVPLMWIQPVYRLLWPIAQRVMKVKECLLPVRMEEWHTYTLEWRNDGASFAVDGIEMMRSSYAPSGPLGLVIWFDNQYMVLTPQGKMRHGNVAAAAPEWMEVSEIVVTTG